jgi:hypothetical protein
MVEAIATAIFYYAIWLRSWPPESAKKRNKNGECARDACTTCFFEADACVPGKEPTVASTCEFPSRLAESSVRKNGTVLGFFLLPQSYRCPKTVSRNEATTQPPDDAPYGEKGL